MSDESVRIAWKCPFWRVEEHMFTGPDGKPRTWYSAKRPNPNTVHMLGITDEGMVPLLRQWRAPVQDWVWELPAGVCDRQDEPLEETARRELIEETGYRARHIEHLFTGTVSPGLTDEIYNAYLCLDLERVGKGGGTGGERIEVHLVPFYELAHQIVQTAGRGELVDCKIIAHSSLASPRMSDLAEVDPKYARIMWQGARELGRRISRESKGKIGDA